MKKKRILEKLAQSVTEFDPEEARETAEEAVKAEISAYEAVMKGLARGMDRVGKMYEERQYFLPELITAGTR